MAVVAPQVDNPLGKLLERRAARLVADALADTRVVVVSGARQRGKSTLVRVVAGDRASEWRNLDSATVRAAALADPTGFVELPGLTVVDEIQRVPDLLRHESHRRRIRDAPVSAPGRR